tara:strand:- start:42 stop:449 length:408 start_codon:yes stop_codon:yes gene_type:complete
VKIYNCNEVNISHKQLLKLRDNNQARLIIDNILAIDILTKNHLRPGNTYLYTFLILSIFAIGVLGFSIYLSFSNSWWWFIPGILISFIIWNANRKSVSDNLVDEALRDESFYDKIKKIKGWMYQIDPNDAKKYLI